MFQIAGVIFFVSFRGRRGAGVARQGGGVGFLVEAKPNGDEVFDGEALADDGGGVGLGVEVEEVE